MHSSNPQANKSCTTPSPCGPAFFGYNFGDYLKHWLTLGKKENAKLPKIFRVKLPKIFHIKLPKIFHANNGFLWPGFGEDIAKRTAIILCPSSSR